jgi:aspartyl-tRNA(Asn)/glutamyl-tRNA(Gln) amidotransferase subunit B
MSNLKTKVDSTTLTTKVGLEIHVQLKTKSKMFCRCDNEAQGKRPNTVVCPVCLGLPGALPVANKQAIEYTIKTGLALNCSIPKIAKFDRKHYFYPDLPKGYQISQYDEPFCVGGFVEVMGHTIRLNRIHLEEDAGKLVHSGNKSLVDLNRAGTPLMEIVSEPDITSPEMAGEFLRKLQKMVRDVAQVSEASMEKGHMRCDANISVSDENGFMSPIVELKNINSFRFVEKALTLVDAQIRDEYEKWPTKPSKETWGYDSEKNKVYLQRRKEEAADYRYFPCPDLPPIESADFDLDVLMKSISKTEEETVAGLIGSGIIESDARILASNKNKLAVYEAVVNSNSQVDLKILIPIAAKVVVHNYFGFEIDAKDTKIESYSRAVHDFIFKNLTKNVLVEIASEIRDTDKGYDQIFSEKASVTQDDSVLEAIIVKVLESNATELSRYRAGEKQLIGFFMGQIMRETKGKADPKLLNQILNKHLEE